MRSRWANRVSDWPIAAHAFTGDPAPLTIQPLKAAVDGKGIVMDGFMQSVRQVGYAVRDLDAAVRHFEAMNGPAHEFWRFQVDLDAACDYRYRGEPAACRLDVALTTVNGLDHEFIQVLSGRHPTADFVAEHGEGINHLALYVADLSGHRDRFIAMGGKIVAQGEFRDSASPARRFAYFAFDNRPYPLYELVELKSLGS
jgi:hypothetical protein